MSINFIGGIHGVGKGTICRIVCKQTNLIHLTASEILKWNEVSAIDNKNVDNIQNTQDRLIIGLNKIIKKDKDYLLDGHFCLFNSEGAVERIPVETFKKIAPKLIIVVVVEVKLIKQRLEKRDGKAYNFDSLYDMQTTEIEYAKQIALALNVPFIKIKDGDYQPLIEVLL